jgi:hypothetical protein
VEKGKGEIQIQKCEVVARCDAAAGVVAFDEIVVSAWVEGGDMLACVLAIAVIQGAKGCLS